MTSPSSAEQDNSRIVQLDEHETTLLGFDSVDTGWPVATVTRLSKGESIGPARIAVETNVRPGHIAAALWRKVLSGEKARRGVIALAEEDDTETAEWYARLGMKEVTTSIRHLGDRAIGRAVYASRVDYLQAALAQSINF